MFVVVMVVVVVVGVGPSLAAPPFPYSLTHQEMIMSIIVNQMAILKGMNKSTSFSASHGDEVNQLRQDMEKEWQAMNETVEGINDMNHTIHTGINVLRETTKNEIKRLNETGENRTRTMSEMNGKIQSINRNIQREVRKFVEEMETEINNKIDAINQTVQNWMTEMNEKRMNDTQRVMEKLEAVQNTAAAHHQRPNPNDLYANHNDSLNSLCDGHKVLYGGDGGLMVKSSGNYNNNMHCSWTVTLPEGTRPVFRWYYFDIQKCSPCSKCDYVYITDPNHPYTYSYCGDNAPDGSFLTVTNNKFKVLFRSDGSQTGRGFRLQYRAVER